MIWVRGGGFWLLGLVWLVAWVGCVYAADGNGKSEKTASAVESEGEDTVEKSPTNEPEALEIPLEQMAGLWRRGLRELEPDLHVYRDIPEEDRKLYTPKQLKMFRHKLAQSLVNPIEKAMHEFPHRRFRPSPGFAVQGRNRQALPGVHRVLVQDEQPYKFFSSEKEVSLVFLTHRCNHDVRLDRVVRTGNKIEIRYMMIARSRPSGDWNLVLIPCGKLPVGEYQVEMIRSVSREKEVTQPGLLPVPLNLEEWAVCKSFTFSVSDPPVDNSSPVEYIKLRDIWALDMPRTKDIRRLEPEVYNTRGLPWQTLEERRPLVDSLIFQIQQALQEDKEGGIENIQRCGFVVEGGGIDALRAIHRVLVKKEAPQTVFRAGSELSLCFYSLELGTYAQLTSVQRQKNCVELHYHFQAYPDSMSSDHFAMIPVTCLDKGEVAIEIIQEPNLWAQTISWKPGDPMIWTTNEEWGENLICRPFSFQIE